jgi:hypothetical protein
LGLLPKSKLVESGVVGVNSVFWGHRWGQLCTLDSFALIRAMAAEAAVRKDNDSTSAAVMGITGS